MKTAMLTLLAFAPGLVAGQGHSVNEWAFEQESWHNASGFHTAPYAERKEFQSFAKMPAGLGQFYLGTGRFAALSKLDGSVVVDGGVGCTALLTVKLAYADLPHNVSAPCTKDICNKAALADRTRTMLAIDGSTGDQAAFAAVHRQDRCVRAREGQRERTAGVPTDFCIGIGYDGLKDAAETAPYTESVNLMPTATAASLNYDTPLYFKATTDNLRRFFVRYELSFPTGTGCSATVSLGWTARTGMPEERHCVAKQDTRDFLARAGEGDAMHGNQTSASARLPRLAADTHVAKTVVIPSSGATYMTLGRAPQVDLTCLDTYFTPYQVSPDAACKKTQYGRHFEGQPEAVGGTPTLNSVSVWELHACSVFTDRTAVDFREAGAIRMHEDYFRCCPQATEEKCNRQNAQARGVENPCVWVGAENSCLPTFEAREVNVEAASGKQYTTTLSSFRANRADSTYYPTDEGMWSGQEADNNRLWVMKIENKQAAGCPQLATVSYVSAPTSGICEPSTRKMCDASFEECTFEQSPWSIFLDEAPKFFNANHTGDKHYRTCNCLKRKEVCYRKGGCLATKKYELILQNCDEVGCGNWCDSAATAQISFVAVIVAALALAM
eukprot:TRINITY_DN1364_c0_g1_i1.p1 TRINITY_DN1364_c0_g1~~TRINITY_DN1364_c0_g1_i1.p1  ORF type:complete len:612 (+),score=208.84 TRINITY_DN1364_c0_g1_i1:91-1926(+)